MSTYTPGPWTYEADTLAIVRLIITPEDVDTWHVESEQRSIGYLHRGSPEDEANACLIAAAPELLEALQDIAEGRNVPDDLLTLDVHTFRSVWITLIQRRARAAIAKAIDAG